MTRRRWVLAAIGLAGLAWVVGAEWVSTTYRVPENHVLDGAVGLAWLIAGLVIADRQPGNRLGPLILLWFFLYYTGNWANTENPILVSFAGGPVMWIQIAILIHVVLAYPTGRLQTRLDVAYVTAVYVMNIVWAVVWMLTFDASAYLGCAPCPTFGLAFFPSAAVMNWLISADPWFTWPTTAALVVLMARRFVGASRAERPALLAVWVGFAVSTGVLLIQYALSYLHLSPTGELYRILRDLNYVGLIAIPLVMLWGLLERRLARSAAGDLMVRLEHPLPPGELRAEIGRTLHDQELALAFPREDGGGWVDELGAHVDLDAIADGRRITPVERDGVDLALLVHDPTLDPELVRAASAVAAMSLENARLQAEIRAQLDEVRASRARIVSAGDEERRRLERDLHDGAQQRLLSLAFALRSARRRLDGNVDQNVGALLGEADDELRAAIGELRDLAHGIHPAILTEEGLAPAVRALGERSPATVRIGSTPDRRLPSEVEATAYFVISEALANTAKHAEGSHAYVEARVANGSLLVEIRDEGSGDVDPSKGKGLRGLQDRVSAIGGTLLIESRAGEGTRLVAEIPCE